MKRANGTGTVYRLNSGNRRNRWVAAVSYYDKDCKLRQKALGYFKTAKEAQMCLKNYNANPYDVSATNITFGKIYDLWAEREYKNCSRQKEVSYSAAFKKCKAIENMPIYKIKLAQLQRIMDNLTGMSASTVNNVKIVIAAVYNYALKYEYINKDVSKFLEAPETATKKEKRIYTEEEIEKLWELVPKDRTAVIVICLIYTGYRVTEFLEMPIENIDIEKGAIFGGGKKTKAGKNRIVPIHHKILPLIKLLIEETKPYQNTLLSMSYASFQTKYKSLMQRLGTKHTIHETRHPYVKYKLKNFSNIFSDKSLHFPNDLDSVIGINENLVD